MVTTNLRELRKAADYLEMVVKKHILGIITTPRCIEIIREAADELEKYQTGAVERTAPAEEMRKD